MEVFLSKQQLIEKIIRHGSESVESRQIASRLKKLLPDRVKSLKEHYQKEVSVGKARRWALLDQNYKKHVQEYLDLREQSNKNRVMWETYRMYYFAKKTRVI